MAMTDSVGARWKELMPGKMWMARESEVAEKVKEIQQRTLNVLVASEVTPLVVETVDEDVVILQPLSPGGPSTVVVGHGLAKDLLGEGRKWTPRSPLWSSTPVSVKEVSGPSESTCVEGKETVNGRIQIQTVGVRFRKTNGEPILRLDASIKEDGGVEDGKVFEESLKKMLRLVNQRMHLPIPDRAVSEGSFEKVSLPESKRTLTLPAPRRARQVPLSPPTNLREDTERKGAVSPASILDTEERGCGGKFGTANQLFTSKHVGEALSSLDHVNTVIFFDWDDTLIPSSYLKECGVFMEATVTLGSALKRKLGEIEERVISLLKEASQYAVVSLITNSTPQWMQLTLRRVMPRLEQFLLTSNIKFVSARRNFIHRFPGQPKKWKAECFLSELRSLPQDKHFNVIVLGDSMEDILAGHEAVRGIRTSKIKVVKLKELPTLDQLKHELDFISDHLEILVKHPGSVELRIVA